VGQKRRKEKQKEKGLGASELKFNTYAVAKCGGSNDVKRRDNNKESGGNESNVRGRRISVNGAVREPRSKMERAAKAERKKGVSDEERQMFPR
jgi:hypothetical protein